MATVSGYTIIEELDESESICMYRAQRDHDQAPVILKMLKEYPTPSSIAQIKHEYNITKDLGINGVVKTYELRQDDNRYVLILEDMGGKSLKEFITPGGLDLTTFLYIATQLAETLSHLHKHHIIHKDVKPDNIIVDPESWEVKITDFDMAAHLSTAKPTINSQGVMEGTLNYMSPEQTGRTNLAIDYRTDFYSLGVTFYELLTGQLPFPTSDPMELIHRHIAKQPRPPHELRSLPRTVSEIVLKLMDKNPEKRYQSAAGLHTDLKECLHQWQTHEQIKSFPLGRYDFRDYFQISQKLYGRSREISLLLEAFERINQGDAELLLLSGPAGMGKTHLIREIQKPVTEKRGYFINAKFNELQQDTPYISLIESFRTLFQQVLMENESRITHWREKLSVALADDGQLITGMIPELELIIGSQSEMPMLNPTQTQNYFDSVFQRLIQVFAQSDHPLVIFMDNLQWMDLATLGLVRSLMTDPETQHLLLIGAYRDNLVTDNHPLTLATKEMKEKGATLHHMTLKSLDFSNVAQLIADTFNTDQDNVTTLADLVVSKTGGNPFFVGEFLKSLYKDNLITFVHPTEVEAQNNGQGNLATLQKSTGGWQWDLGEIQALEITDNVVELMTERVQQLGEESRHILTLAACLGDQFDLGSLAIISEKLESETATILWEPIAEGLVLPLSDTHRLATLGLDNQQLDATTIEYKFSHNRIRKAAYSLISAGEKLSVHRQIGQRLLHHLPEEKQEQRIFDIVNQLNLSSQLIEKQAERYELATLDLKAGRKAKSMAAYQLALNYLQIGIRLLTTASDSSWQVQYQLALNLYREAAEVAYLHGEYDTMDKLAEVVLEQAESLMDKMDVYKIKIQAHIARNQISEAFADALSVLALLDVNLPEQPDYKDVQRKLTEIQAMLTDKRIDALIDLPKMTDPHKLAAMEILSSMSLAVYATSSEFYTLNVLERVKLSLKYGNSEVSAPTYASYGLILCDEPDDIEAGYQFGQLALRLLEKFKTKSLRAKTLLTVGTAVNHWKSHLKETLPLLQETYESGRETGDLPFAATSLFAHTYHTYFTGAELTELTQQMEAHREIFQELKQDTPQQMSNIFHQAILNLMGPSENPTYLKGKRYNEEKMLYLHLEGDDHNAIAHLYLNKLILSYLFGDYRQAIVNTTKLERFSEPLSSTYGQSIFNFYDSLVWLANYQDVTEIEQMQILERIMTNQEDMQAWATQAPMNFMHKYYLVEAERSRVMNDDGTAREFYDQAAALAKENGFIQEEALAYELAAKFYLTKDRTKIAQNYLRDAHYAYLNWGASAKVKALEAAYPKILGQTEARPSSKRRPSAKTVSTTGQSSTQALDLSSVVKATQIIAGEIVLPKLLSKLMELVIENAGAERGFLILDKDSRWVIKAQGAIDKDEVVMQSVPVESKDGTARLPLSIINYVARTKENVVLQDASHENHQFSQAPYIKAKQPLSLLCMPLLNQGKLIGMLYLENNLASGVFTANRLQILNLISAQAAISIENARLYTSITTSEKRYRSLFEDSRDAIFISKPDGQIIDVNQASLTMFGYTQEEMLQLKAEEFYADLDDWLKFRHEINENGSVQDFEAKFRRKDGSEGDCVVTATVRWSDDENESKMLGYQGIIRDITEHKQMDNLKQAFLGVITHELRSPFVSAGLSVELVRRYAEREMWSELRDQVNQLDEELVEGRRLIDSVVSFASVMSKQSKLMLVDTQIGKLIREATKPLQKMAQARNIDISYKLSAKLPLVQWDRERMGEAIYHLVHNALKFNREGGSVKITCWSTSSQIVFKVEDTGAGLPEEKLDTIWEAFAQTADDMQRGVEGLGLGLALVKLAVQAHSGEVAATSKLGVGSTFGFRIPIHY